MSSSLLSERAVERWQEVRFGQVVGCVRYLVGAANIFRNLSSPICNQTESIIID